MTIHFAAKQSFEDGTVRLNWCKMTFKPDFMKMLHEYGTIPKQNIKSVLVLMNMQKAGKKAIEERDKQFKESQDIIKRMHLEKVLKD